MYPIIKSILKNNTMTDNKELINLFHESKYYSLKYKNYFPVYEKLFSKYREKKITFVEIGVLSGGSLFMWRNYFGKNLNAKDYAHLHHTNIPGSNKFVLKIKSFLKSFRGNLKYVVFKINEHISKKYFK